MTAHWGHLQSRNTHLTFHPALFFFTGKVQCLKEGTQYQQILSLHNGLLTALPEGEEYENILYNKGKWVYKLPEGKLAFLIATHLTVSQMFMLF